MDNNTPQDNSPIRSADNAYYASKSPSAINNRHAITRRGKPGTPLQVDRTPHQQEHDTSTDRYYRSGGSRFSQRGQPHGKLSVPLEPQRINRRGVAVDAVRAPGSTYTAPGLGEVAVPIRIKNKGEIVAVKEAIFAAINRGEKRVFVQVSGAECERLIQAAIELGVARGQITEDRLRDITIGPIVNSGEALAEQMFGKVQPPAQVETIGGGQIANGSDIEDFDKFVKGETVHDTDDDLPPSAPEVPAAIPLAPVESPTLQQEGSVGISTGSLGDPVTHAAAGEMPEAAKLDGVQRVAVRTPTTSAARGRRGAPKLAPAPAPAADPVSATATAAETFESESKTDTDD